MTAKQPAAATATASRVQPSSLLQRRLPVSGPALAAGPSPRPLARSSSPLPPGEGPGVRAALPTTLSVPAPLLSAPITLQPKLTVNTPGDKYEQEADRVADMVMRMPEPTNQRECATYGAKSPTAGECSDRKKKQGLGGTLQRLSTHGDSAAGMAAPPIVNRVLASSGQPLSSSTRSFFESRFGRDLSSVRVHQGNQAQESARSVQARAYTVGHNIVLGAGESAAPSALMAHELTHVFQQTSGSVSGILSRAPDPTDLSKIDGSIISKLRKALDDWMSGAKNLDPKVYSLGLDLFQFALDIIGVVEPTPIADGVNAVISVARGDWWGAAFSGLGMIPYVGDLAKAGKLGKYAKSMAQAIELASKSPQVAKMLRPVMEVLADALRSAEKHLPSKVAATVSSMRSQLDTFLTQGAKAAAHSPRAPIIDPNKFKYLFGEVGNARSLQNASELKRIGLHNTDEGVEVLTTHLSHVAQDPSNVVREFQKVLPDGTVINQEVRESLLAGPGGFIRLESSWEILADGTRKFTTLIPSTPKLK